MQRVTTQDRSDSPTHGHSTPASDANQSITPPSHSVTTATAAMNTAIKPRMKMC